MDTCLTSGLAQAADAYEKRKSAAAATRLATIMEEEGTTEEESSDDEEAEEVCQAAIRDTEKRWSSDGEDCKFTQLSLEDWYQMQADLQDSGWTVQVAKGKLLMIAPTVSKQEVYSGNIGVQSAKTLGPTNRWDPKKAVFDAEDAKSIQLYVWVQERQEAFRLARSSTFADCIVCSTGLDAAARTSLKGLVAKGGGTYEGVFTSKRTTHLVALQAGGPKYEAALRFRSSCKVVRPAWFLESILQCRKLDERDGRFRVGGKGKAAVAPAPAAQTAEAAKTVKSTQERQGRHDARMMARLEAQEAREATEARLAMLATARDAQAARAAKAAATAAQVAQLAAAAAADTVAAAVKAAQLIQSPDARALVHAWLMLWDQLTEEGWGINAYTIAGKSTICYLMPHANHAKAKLGVDTFASQEDVITWRWQQHEAQKRLAHQERKERWAAERAKARQERQERQAVTHYLWDDEGTRHKHKRPRY